MAVGSDTFAGAAVTSLPSLSDPTPNTTYGVEAGEPDPYAGNPNWGGWAVNRTAWWSFTPTADADVQFHSQRSYYTDGSYPDYVADTLIALYTGDSIDTLTLVTNGHADTNGGGDYTPWACAAHVTAGTTYWVQVSSIYSEDLTYVLTVVDVPVAGSTTPAATDLVTAPRNAFSSGTAGWESVGSSAPATVAEALAEVWTLSGATVAKDVSAGEGLFVSSDSSGATAEWYGIWTSLTLDDSRAPTSGTPQAPSGPVAAYDEATPTVARQLLSQDPQVEVANDDAHGGLFAAGQVFHIMQGAAGFAAGTIYDPDPRTAASIASDTHLAAYAAEYSSDDVRLNGQHNVAHFSLPAGATTVALILIDDATYTQTAPDVTFMSLGWSATFSVIGTYQFSYSYPYWQIPVAGAVEGGNIQPYRARQRLHPIASARRWPREPWTGSSSRRVGGYR